MTILAATGLTKRFGRVTAVESLGLEVRQGEVYAFLGLNGAGKTTTIRMLLGLIRPTAGEVRMFGQPIGGGGEARGLRAARGARGVFRRVGYLVEAATAYGNLTVRENLEIQRRLTGAAASAVPGVIDRLGLERYAGRRADVLSLGNKQRLSLARALLHRPELLILDEPANALDPAGIVEVRQLLRELVDEEGVTVFMSSHILGEVAQLADRLGIVHEGRLLEELDRAELRDRTRAYVEVRTHDRDRARKLLAGAGFKQVEATGDRLRVLDPHVEPAAIARLLVEDGLELSALVPGREDLEAYFLRLTGGAA